MFIYTIIIILLIIPIIIIMIIPQDQGSAWRHSRGQLLLQRLSRQRFTEGREDIAAMPLGTFANLRDGYTAVQNGPSLGIQTSNMNIYYMNHWGMSSETRKKKVQETKQMHTKGTTVAASQHIGKIPQEKNTPSQLSLHLIQAGGPCRHTGLPN